MQVRLGSRQHACELRAQGLRKRPGAVLLIQPLGLLSRDLDGVTITAATRRHVGDGERGGERKQATVSFPRRGSEAIAGSSLGELVLPLVRMSLPAVCSP